jgi:hypothetical protein
MYRAVMKVNGIADNSCQDDRKANGQISYGTHRLSPPFYLELNCALASQKMMVTKVKIGSTFLLSRQIFSTLPQQYAITP